MGRYNCIDCGVNTSNIDEYYMVQFDLWNQFVPESKDGTMLCIRCLEKRLGRELTPEDFIGCPLNNDDDNWTKSDKLLNRLGRIMDEITHICNDI